MKTILSLVIASSLFVPFAYAEELEEEQYGVVPTCFVMNRVHEDCPQLEKGNPWEYVYQEPKSEEQIKQEKLIEALTQLISLLTQLIAQK